ncbi:hypothetical protein GGR50DRAFT_248667 [Xylaria sp. CBS 124048]|nr:hypothetical protein GGR50DRAFT_248667 [Xylaria sp. CBS 124048]
MQAATHVPLFQTRRDETRRDETRRGADAVCRGTSPPPPDRKSALGHLAGHAICYSVMLHVFSLPFYACVCLSLLMSDKRRVNICSLIFKLLDGGVCFRQEVCDFKMARLIRPGKLVLDVVFRFLFDFFSISFLSPIKQVGGENGIRAAVRPYLYWRAPFIMRQPIPSRQRVGVHSSAGSITCWCGWMDDTTYTILYTYQCTCASRARNACTYVSSNMTHTYTWGCEWVVDGLVGLDGLDGGI